MCATICAKRCLTCAGFLIFILPKLFLKGLKYSRNEHISQKKCHNFAKSLEKRTPVLYNNSAMTPFFQKFRKI